MVQSTDAVFNARTTHLTFSWSSFRNSVSPRTKYLSMISFLCACLRIRFESLLWGGAPPPWLSESDVCSGGSGSPSSVRSKLMTIEPSCVPMYLPENSVVLPSSVATLIVIRLPSGRDVIADGTFEFILLSGMYSRSFRKSSRLAKRSPKVPRFVSSYIIWWVLHSQASKEEITSEEGV